MDDRAKKLLFLIAGIIGIIIVIFIVAMFVGKIKNSSLSYVEIENKLVSAAEDYFNDNSDELPLTEEETVDVSVSILESGGYLKKLSSYQKDESVICDGSVKVSKTADFYRYAPYLDCGDKYRTIYLYEKVLDNVVTSGDGLYKTTQYSKDKQGVTRYIYKGEYVSNYVELDEELWRIVKINEDNTITLIKAVFDGNENTKSVWDDRYNVNTNGYDGINNFDESRIKRTLTKYYDKFSDDLKTKLVLTTNCVGTRLRNDSKNDGSIECAKIAEPSYVSLLPIYDYINASDDANCKTLDDLSCSNYNYLTKYTKSWWTLTVNKNYDTTAYVINKSPSRVDFNKSNYIRMVITLNENVVYSGGSGEKKDPYIIK